MKLFILIIIITLLLTKSVFVAKLNTKSNKVIIKKHCIEYHVSCDNETWIGIYKFIRDDFDLIMIGPHENYYRDLKNYIKVR